MKQKLRERVKKVEAVVEDVATEIGLVDPPLHPPSEGLKDSEKGGGAVPQDKPQALEKTAQKARKKVKKF